MLIPLRWQYLSKFIYSRILLAFYRYNVAIKQCVNIAIEWKVFNILMESIVALWCIKGRKNGLDSSICFRFVYLNSALDCFHFCEVFEHIVPRSLNIATHKCNAMEKNWKHILDVCTLYSVHTVCVSVQ